ncbi:MAG: C25 family cysteine peptidase [Bacteroidota bacterium]
MLFIRIALLTCFYVQGIKLHTGAEAETFSLEFVQSHFVFRGQLASLELNKIEKPGHYMDLSIPGFYKVGIPGGPALPQKSILFEAAKEGISGIRILNCDSVVFDLETMGLDHKLLPFQASQKKGISASPLFFNEDIYAMDDWTGSEMIGLNYEGIMRGVSMYRLAFNPVCYNPYRNQIKVYYNVKCIIETASTARTQELSPEFNSLFKRVVMQQSPPVKKALEVENPMTLVILSDTLFRETLRPLVQWKIRKGFKVVEAYRQDPEVGSSEMSIKSYLNTLYSKPSEDLAPPAFLLIVGDVEHIPLSRSTGQITDLYYSTYDGPEDYIPDLFYGRISVANPGQLENVVEKILEYEQYKLADPSFLDEAILIAGVDGSFAPRHGNGQITYATSNYFNEVHGLKAHAFLYPESDTSDQIILDLFSEGAGFVNYTGHGLHDQWINPAFHQNDIDGLRNKGKYPLVIGNGCETNVFTLGECFAEALIRAPEKGALAYIGCTNDSYWDEDYYWSVGVGPILADPSYEGTSPGYYDRVFHSHGEEVELWTPSLGEMIFGGNLSVQESNSPRKKFYWEIYQLAGDPSLVPWFGQAVQRNVQYSRNLPAGTKRLDLACAPRDYAAISRNGILLDAAHASKDGLLTLDLPDSLADGKLDLVVSGDRYIPYSGEVILGEFQEAYLDLVDYQIRDESRSQDGKISQSEQFSLDIQLINRGKADLGPDTLVLGSRHSHLSIMDSLLIMEGLGAGDTLSLAGIFRIGSASGLSDQEAVVMELYSRGDTTEKRFFLREKIVAPLLESKGITWDDRALGNGNGIADAGEWLECSWDIRNSGHLASGELRTEQAKDDAPFILLHPGEQKSLSFQLKVEAEWNGLFRAGPIVAGDSFNFIRDSFYIYPGQHFEDFSHGEADRFAFINSSSLPWLIDNQSYNTYPYALRSGFPGSQEKSEIGLTFEIPVRDTLSFTFRVSSEEAYDFLEFSVDSVLVRRWSGEQDWSSCFHILEPGRHSVSWAYVKDESISMGEDAAWIDDLVFPSKAFNIHDLSLSGILSPDSGPWLSASERFSVRVKNSGTDTARSFSAGILVDGMEICADTFSVTLLPGQEIQIPLSGQVDLSAKRAYDVLAWISGPGDDYRGNNRIHASIDHYSYPDLSLTLDRIVETEGIQMDAVISMRNEGNVRIDTLSYELWINDSLRESGSRFIGLDAGEGTSSMFLLADSSMADLKEGFFAFLFRSVTPDSVAGNNELTGRPFWKVLSADGPGSIRQVTLYPNPARKGVSMSLSEPFPNRLIVYLVDSAGRKLASYVLPAGKDRLYIPFGNLGPGTYLLNLENSGITLPLFIAE